MKKLKKNKQKFIWLIGLYLLVLFTINIAYSFLNQNLALRGETSFSISATRDFSYTYIKNSNWNSGGYYYYYYTPTITYLESLTASSWQVNVWVPSNSEITGCYNASSCQISGNVLRIKNASYNGTVFQNGKISPGFILKTSEPNFVFTIMSVNFYNTGDIVIVDPDPEGPSPEQISGFITTLVVSTSWGKVTQYALTINNQSLVNLKSWEIKIEFPVGTTVESIWGANYVLSGTTLILSGASYALGINVNTVVDIGIQMKILKVQTPYQNTIVSFTGVTENNADVIINL